MDEISASSSRCRVTVRLLQLNHPDRLEDREVLIAGGVVRGPSTSTAP
jgi:hypothetical protein